MKRLFLIACLLVLAGSAAVAVAQAPAGAASLSDTGVIAESIEAESVTQLGEAVPIDLEALLNESDKTSSQAMSTICGTYTAPNSAGCNFNGCMQIGCGAPSHYDPGPCVCYCSYMF